MRKLGVAVAVLAAVGCADDGVYLEVVAPDGMTEVELFVVERECDGQDTEPSPFGCSSGLQPEGFAAKIRGEVFIRAQDEGENWRVPVEDGSAWFRFGIDTKFPLQRVVAIGLLDGEVRQAAVLDQVDLSSTRKVSVTLEDAVEWSGDERDPGETRALARWAEGRCIGVHDSGQPYFIVTDGDADCDQVPAETECDPLAYLVDSPTSQACLSSENGQCSIGERVCSETSPDPATNLTCPAGDIALDPDVCAMCADPLSSMDCVGTAVLESLPRIVCTFGYEPEGPDRTCPSGTNGSSPTHIYRAGVPMGFCPADFGIAAPVVPFPGFDRDYEEAGWASVKVELIDDGSQNCVKVDWFGFDQGGEDATPVNKTLLFWSTGDPGGPNHVLPIDFVFEPGCDNQEADCKLVSQ